MSSIRPLIAGVLAIASVATGSHAASNLQRHALLVGVADYQNDAMAPLPYAEADATRLRNVLTERGDYRGGAVTTITNATGGELKQAISEFLAPLEAGDSVMIYFSGHGDLGDDRQLYLAPSDFDPAKTGDTGVPAAWLREQLAACKADAKLLVLDACHAGASDRGVTSENVLSGFDEAEGVVTLASSAAAQSSLMDGGLQGSLFSFWLAKALTGHADRDSDGLVTVGETFSYVDRHVTAEALRRYGENQSPRMSRNMAVTGDPAITALLPQPLDVVLDDMANQIAWHAANERLGVVGCLSEFTTNIWADGHFASVLGVESGMAGKTLATRFQGKIKEKLSQLPNTMQLVSQQEADNAVRSGKTDFVSLVGDIRVQQGDSLLLQASIRKGGVDLHSVAGRATVSVDDWAEHGHSVVVRPSDFRTARDPATGVMKSAESVAVATLDERVNAADYQHPMASDDLGCGIRLRVPTGRNSYYMRKPTFHDGRAYVALDKGEEYEIALDYDLAKLNGGRPVYAKILVDGVSIRNPQIAPEQSSGSAEASPETNEANESGPRFYDRQPGESNTRRPGGEGGPVFYKGVDLVRMARHTPVASLGLQQMWLLDGQTKPLVYRGFYVGPDKDAFRFKVVDSAESIGAKRDYGESVGLISVILYDVLGASRGSDVGTAPGLPIAGARLRQVKAPGGVGRQIAVLHLNYCSSAALSQLSR
ncbi:MAG: caspase family protein [Planctomycetota bacterium]